MPEASSSHGIAGNPTGLEKRLLTDKFISSYASEINPHQVVYDTGVDRLLLQISEHGKNFHLLLNGSTELLGPWPEMSVEEAREAAITRIRADAKTSKQPGGTSPHDIPERTQKTLQEVFQDYAALRSLKPATVDDYQAVLNRYARDWLKRDWYSLTPDIFEDRFAEVSTRSRAQANYFVRLMAALWKFATIKYDVDLKNPTERLKALGGLHKIRPKDNIIPDAIQPKWWSAVQKLDNSHLTAALIFLALTGCRKGEALKTQCSDIDWQARVITFSETKNGTIHRIPLPDRLHSFLYQHCRGRSGPVFAVSDRGINYVASEISKRIGYKWTLHDLRRTFVTVAHRTLGDLATVKRLVNHSTGGDVTMKHYLKLTVDDLRDPMQAVENTFAMLAQREKPGF
jgi:integrase